VAILTRQDGVAANFSTISNGINVTANVYYSLWLAFFNSVFILSKWQRTKYDAGEEIERQASNHNIDSADIEDDL
jgi:hypothetical protein